MRQAAAMASLAAALPVAMPSAQDGEEVRRAGLWVASAAVMALLHVGGADRHRIPTSRDTARSACSGHGD
jgi:hypothetical protein